MTYPIIQIDAFTNQVFQGNPAAIVPLDGWLDDETMQKIAMENNLAETAFLVKTGNGYHLRWFTPKYEVDLCGHATLASAHYLFTLGGYDLEKVEFATRSGLLTVQKSQKGYTMDFPKDEISRCQDTREFSKLLPQVDILEVWKGKTDYLLQLKNEEQVRSIHREFNALAHWPDRGFIVTAGSSEYDFVSRCFYPGAGVDEDPVTGSAHTSLVPFWHNKNGKTDFMAYQASERGGVILCRLEGDRVKLAGEAVTYLVGEIYL